MAQQPPAASDLEAQDRQARARALVCSDSVWLAASAGSGKTHALIDRILALLLDGANPQRLLCLTYTRAAAAEMLERLAGRLIAWATDKETREREVLAIVGDGLAPDECEKKFALAGRLFFIALDSPGGIRVRTIHAWCQELLHSFPLEAGVPPDFEVLEESAAGRVRHEAKVRSLRQASGTGGSASHDFLSRYASEDQLNLVLRDIWEGKEEAFASAVSSEQEAQTLLGTRLGWQAPSFDAIESFAEEVCKLDAEAGDAEKVVGLLIQHGSKTLAERAQAARQWLRADRDQQLKDPEPWLNLFLVKAWQGGVRPARGKFPSNGFCEKLEPEDALLAQSFIAQEAERLVAILQTRTQALATQASLALGDLAQGFATFYAAAKRRQHALDYNDLILKSQALLCDSAAAAWVRYRLDGGLHHLLIDEAQDTNPEQWRVVRALIEEFYAGASAHEDRGGKPRTFFAVGDTKQSIFSFQGANVVSTTRFLSNLGAEVQAKGMGWQNLSLSRSYRSAPPILRLVDEVFARQEDGEGEGEAEAGDTTDDFFNLRHFAERDGAAGLVEIYPVVPKPTQTETQDDSDTRTANQQLVEYLAEQIDGWLNPPTPPRAGDAAWLASENRPLRARDIMILLQSRTPLMPLLASALRGKNIQIAQAERIRLATRPIVADLSALGETLVNRDHNLFLALTLKSPFCGLRDADLLALVREARTHGGADKKRGTLFSGALWSALENSSAPLCQVAVDRLRRWRGLSVRARISDLFEQILAEVGRANITAVLGDSAEEDLQKFLSYALVWEEKTRGASLVRFLHALENDTTEQSATSHHGENAVRILTVHSAKGLEAPVVILPQTIRGKQGQKEKTLLWLQNEGRSFPLWFARSKDVPEEVTALLAPQRAIEMSERERLLYVALTRARDRLHIYGVAQRVAKEPDGRDGWSQGAGAPLSWYERVYDGAERLAEAVGEDSSARLQVERVKGLAPWSDEAVWRFFSTGQEKAQVKKKQETASPPAQELALPAWCDKEVSPDPGGGVQVIAASSLSLSGSVDEGRKKPSPQQAQEKTPPVISPALRGTLIHALLQYLPEVAKEQRPERGSAWLAKQLAQELDGREDLQTISQTISAEILARALSVLDDPEIAPLFAPLGLAEVPLIGVLHPTTRGTTGDTAPLFINGRVDRLVVRDDKIIVVDYKSDRTPPATPQEVGRNYLAQMAAYQSLLQALYANRPVEAGLLWTETPKWMPLPQDLLDKALPRLARQEVRENSA